jgi:hypothetical protein
LRVKWIIQDQIGSTIDGTKQGDFECLNVSQNRKTTSAGTYHFGNKKHVPSSLIIIIIIILGIKFLAKFSCIAWMPVPLKRTKNIFNETF